MNRKGRRQTQRSAAYHHIGRHEDNLHNLSSARLPTNSTRRHCRINPSPVNLGLSYTSSQSEAFGADSIGVTVKKLVCRGTSTPGVKGVNVHGYPCDQVKFPTQLMLTSPMAEKGDGSLGRPVCPPRKRCQSPPLLSIRPAVAIPTKGLLL